MESVRAFMNGLIDYAGLFPPAKLEMGPAVRNFAEYLAGEDAWMLGRFICPAARMEEFAECFDDLDFAPAGAKNPDQVWRISALGGRHENAEAFLAGMKSDLAAMMELVKRFEGRIEVDGYEALLPPALLKSGDAAAITDLAGRITRMIDEGAPGSLTPFLEIGFAGDWSTAVPLAVEALAEHNRRAFDPAEEASTISDPVAVKVRTGGVEASMFPSVEEVACLIRACCRNRVGFKATAGLHHPLRHYSENVRTKMHGFVNVFVAGILSCTHELHEDTVREILHEENAENFRFHEDGLAWHSIGASNGQIIEARRRLALSFGSCSFDEPREDLRELGLL